MSGEKTKEEECRERAKHFEEIIRPIIEWMNDNCHPHTKIIVDCTSAELVEGVTGFTTEDYLKD
jgi:hypothetical protein